MLATETDPSALAGLEIVDIHGERIGRVRQVYPDGEGIGWVGVRGNLFGTEEALVPLDGAVLEDEVIGVLVARSRFQSAPRRRPDAQLSEEEVDHLRAYWAEPVPAPAVPAAADLTDSGAADPDSDGVMTASEERLVATTSRVARMRVRLRKVVITEERTITVPVRREEYRLIREAIPDAVAVPGAVVEPAEQEVVLYEDRIVVTTEVVPVERVRLIKEEVVEQRTVSGTVRQERIEVDDDPAVAAVAELVAETRAPAPAAPPADPMQGRAAAAVPPVSVLAVPVTTAEVEAVFAMPAFVAAEPRAQPVAAAVADRAETTADEADVPADTVEPPEAARSASIQEADPQLDLDLDPAESGDFADPTTPAGDGSAGQSTEAEPASVPIPAASAMATKRSTSSRSPRKPGSTPARSSTSAAATAPPSTGARD